MTGDDSLVNLLVLDDAQTLSNALNFRDDFFLHQIEAHGEKSDAEEQVKRAQSNWRLGTLLIALFSEEELNIIKLCETRKSFRNRQLACAGTKSPKPEND